MKKSAWFWAIGITMFPPLLFVLLFYHFIYLPLRDGVIAGTQFRFYLWGLTIFGLNSLAMIPLPKAKSLEAIYQYLDDPYRSEYFVVALFVLSIVSIICIFLSTRNEVDREQFLPFRNFKSDRLFIICLMLSFLPYITLLLDRPFTFDDIKHPLVYAIAVAFSAKYYLAAFIGFLLISVTTAVLEESFFRGILLRDYFGLSKYKQYALLFLAALYFAFCHTPISFLFPLIFALAINRIRMTYKNLLPGVVLHAVWNANVLIMTLLLLDPTIPKHVQRTVDEEIKVATEIWTMKKIDKAQALFPHHKLKETIHTFEGLHLILILSPDIDDANNIFVMSVLMPEEYKSSEIETFFKEDDWETRRVKSRSKPNENVDVRCSRKKDVCYNPAKKGGILVRFGAEGADHF